MNFGKAFTFVFDDPDWLRKVAINALIGLIPIAGQLYLLGWGLEVARRVASRSMAPLPDVDFGTHIGHGVKALVVALVYTVPIWLIVIPMVAVTVLAEGSTMDYETAAMVMMICNVCGGLLTMVYGLLLGFVLPAAMTRAVLKGSIKAGLEFGQVLARVRSAPGPYLLAFLGTAAASMLAGIVGGIACGIGIVFTMAYYYAVMGHLYGQAYLEASPAR
jgi:hypothetical protein